MGRPSRGVLIRQVILRRIAGGEPLTIRSIQQETGGSNSTVAKELNAILGDDPRFVTGPKANSTPERFREMQQCISQLKEDKAGLESEVKALSNSLKLFKDELQGLIGSMVFTNKQVLLGLDEIRQTVVRLRPQPTSQKSGGESGREIYLTERLNQATKTIVTLTEKNQTLESKLAAAGVDV